MDYIIYPDSSGKHFNFSSSLGKLHQMIEQNVVAFGRHYDSKAVRFESRHALRAIYETLEIYIEESPQATYHAIKERVDIISRTHHLVHPGASQESRPVITNRDFLFPIRGEEPVFQLGGKLAHVEKVDPVKVITHSRTNLHLESYMEPQLGAFGVIGIDLPAMGALMCHYRQTDETPTVHSFLTKLLYINNANKLVHVGLYNRLPELAAQGESEEVDEWKAPYFAQDLDRELEKGAAREMVEHLHKAGNGTLTDLSNNLPVSGINLNAVSAGIKDYYLPELMWLNTACDMKHYKLLADINDSLDLDIETKSIERRLSRFLPESRVSVLTKHLDMDDYLMMSQVISRDSI